MIPAGELDTRITLQAKAAGQDATGQPNGAWSNVATVWARVRDLTTKEFLSADATTNSVDTKIDIRWRADVTNAMRVVIGSRTYKVEGVIDLTRRRENLRLMCCCEAP
jgi:SPP1 family predicted phage head-tail adaptor